MIWQKWLIKRQNLGTLVLNLLIQISLFFYLSFHLCLARGVAMCTFFPLDVLNLLHGALLDKLGDVNQISIRLHANLIFFVKLQNNSALSEEINALCLTQKHYLKFFSLVVRLYKLGQLLIDLIVPLGNVHTSFAHF